MVAIAKRKAHVVIVGGIPCPHCKRLFIPVARGKGKLSRACQRSDCSSRPRVVTAREPVACRGCGESFTPKRKDGRLCTECIANRGSKTYEAQQQKAFVKHVRSRRDMPMAPLNGAPLLNGAVSWADLKAKGAAKGFPDVAIHGPVGKPSLFVEMKSPGEGLRDEQKEWRDHLVELGHTHVVAYSALEAIEAYEAWRAILRGT